MGKRNKVVVAPVASQPSLLSPELMVSLFAVSVVTIGIIAFIIWPGATPYGTVHAIAGISGTNLEPPKRALPGKSERVTCTPN